MSIVKEVWFFPPICGSRWGKSAKGDTCRGALRSYFFYMPSYSLSHILGERDFFPSLQYSFPPMFQYFNIYGDYEQPHPQLIFWIRKYIQ